MGSGLNLPRAKLVERKDINEDLLVIKLQPEQEFKFKPGQYCTLGLDGVERAYSIVSAPHEPLLEIFVELVRTGELTPRMWRMKLGDCMSIRPRGKGIFTLEEKVHHHFMLATVTGVAPCLSMIRSYLYNLSRNGHGEGPDHKFYVLLGALGIYIAESVGLSPAEKGLMVAIPILSGALLRVPLGLLSDRIGGKRVLLSEPFSFFVPYRSFALDGAGPGERPPLHRQALC